MVQTNKHHANLIPETSETKSPRHLMFQMMIWRQEHLWKGQVSPKQKWDGGVKCENVTPKIACDTLELDVDSNYVVDMQCFDMTD